MKAPHQPTEVAGSAPGVDVVLKSLRNPPLNLTLTAQPLTTSVLDLKQRVAVEVGLGGTDKIRLLHNKKPCSDSRSIKDVLGGSETKAEFSVMIMGGVPAKAAESSPAAPAPAAGNEEDEARTAMQDGEFWADLEGYLGQRLKSAHVARDATKAFRQAWSGTGV